MYITYCIYWKTPLLFFCYPGKSLNFVYKSWEVLENIWEVSHASLEQNSEATYPVSRKRRLEGITTDTA